MNEDTINPFKMGGSYVGTLCGLLLYLKGWNIFGWLPPLLSVHFNSLAALDMVGGFLVGYLLHILWRVLSFHAGKLK